MLNDSIKKNPEKLCGSEVRNLWRWLDVVGVMKVEIDKRRCRILRRPSNVSL